MFDDNKELRVLYSFPHKLGAGRICWTAWQQVLGLNSCGVRVTAAVGCTARKPPSAVKTFTTLAFGGLRIPYRLLGIRRAAWVHDFITSLWLALNRSKIDIVHAWPMGALLTIGAARKAGIPVVLERPNCHTAFAYRVVEEECRRLNLTLPKGYEHTYDGALLNHENREYARADFLLCPSDFVKKTFTDCNFEEAKLLRHQYGYDDTLISPGQQDATPAKGLVMIYVGLGTPRKGLHHALKAWLDSDASRRGRFLICGEIVAEYRKFLAPMLSHPSVEVLGHCPDAPEQMRRADLFVLSSIEEGSALVTYEARGAGCVLLVSDAAGAVCEHLVNAMVHSSGDPGELTRHLDTLEHDRILLEKLRKRSLESVGALTWMAAGTRLKELYKEAIKRHACARGSEGMRITATTK